MALLNELRSHASKCEAEVGEAQAKLHNGRMLLADVEDQLAKFIRQHIAVHGLEEALCNESNDVLESLGTLREMLGDATEHLERLY